MTRLYLLGIKRSRVCYGITLFLLVSFLGLYIYDHFEDFGLLYSADNQQKPKPEGKISIVIKIPARSLELYSDGKLYKKYRIAVGKITTPTPIGEWTVVHKEYSWRDVFGTRWMGLDVPWGSYGIHGTNVPWSIGNFASHGCVRMRNKDVEELYQWVPMGTPVKIEGTRVKIKQTLKYRMSGQDVVILQMKLKELGYLEARADGFFGKDTEEAVKRYQYDKGAKVTGIADRETLNRLGI